MLNRNSIFVLTVLVIGLILRFAMSLHAMFVFYGLICGFLFFNVTMSTMTNVLTGALVEKNDTFWRITLMVLSAFFITLGIMV